MNSTSTTSRLFFDITDLVNHARTYRHLTGVQRVMVNILRRLSGRYAESEVRCLFYHPHRRQVYECSAADLLAETQLDTHVMLHRLGVLRNFDRFPSDVQIRRYLRPYSRNKLLRRLKRVHVYFCALLRPGALERLKLVPMHELFRGIEKVKVKEVRQLDCHDEVLVLGGSRSQPLNALLEDHVQRGGQVVTLIHDLIAVRFPQYFSEEHSRAFVAWLMDTVSYTTGYWANSSTTARDLRDFLQASGYERKVTVINLAHEFSGFERNARLEPASPLAQQFAGRSYVLCVGTVEVRKNGATLLRAWVRLHQDLGHRTPQLVFAGKRGWLIEEFDSLLESNPQLRNLVTIVEECSDAELAFLYGHSLFSVFVSFYEGWGLPIGESAWFGKYCIASNTSSMPEVGADLMEYADPRDLHEITEKVRHAILNPAHVEECERLIRAARLRTWNDVADDLGRLLRQTDRSLDEAG